MCLLIWILGLGRLLVAGSLAALLAQGPGLGFQGALGGRVTWLQRSGL